MSPFHMAVSTGQSNIAQYLVLSKIDADHKTSTGMGVLQLAEGTSGKRLRLFNWLLENARTPLGKVLENTYVKSVNVDKGRGANQDVYRQSHCITGKGKAKDKGQCQGHGKGQGHGEGKGQGQGKAKCQGCSTS